MNLAQKLCKASQDVGGALKADKRNQEQRYDYISADKILSVCGQALAANGVIVFPAIVNQTTEAVDRGSNKSPRLDCAIDFIFTVTDGETSLDFTWTGRGSDYSVPDKALYKAITSGHKYFLMKLLNVGEGNEDGEHEQPQQTRQPAKSGNGNRPAAEVLDELGFEPESEPAIDYPADIGIITNSKGEPYVTLDSNRLGIMYRQMKKNLAADDLTPEKRAEQTEKCAAIEKILILRGE